ncbi:MAG: transcriptional regulator [Acidimicrobiaceae bacterium]|nr:XRE family transcriptional regulator [Acidimicrobiaceae bacterium]MXW62075.1 transcriptional regulator [Acidimicrobiaceae bacterium]MXW77034.1 transcriptional regulator [Acidimicrobiaceae bacterium]MYA74869.1 transcriptional regulator [Acidimicrobiaceae bacterium]MYC43666.1 transcriptional regulator [Acidimicrobiaceae bacterium]
MNEKVEAIIVPVDEADIEDVADSAWERDDRPDRFYDKINRDPKAVARFESVLAEIAEHQTTLAQVRKAKLLTQTTIGRLLDMDQSEVSRLERRSDVLLSTLRSFIQAAGGDLHLIATFPDSGPVQLLVGETASEADENRSRRSDQTAKV